MLLVKLHVLLFMVPIDLVLILYWIWQCLVEQQLIQLKRLLSQVKLKKVYLKRMVKSVQNHLINDLILKENIQQLRLELRCKLICKDMDQYLELKSIFRKVVKKWMKFGTCIKKLVLQIGLWLGILILQKVQNQKISYYRLDKLCMLLENEQKVEVLMPEMIFQKEMILNG